MKYNDLLKKIRDTLPDDYSLMKDHIPSLHQKVSGVIESLFSDFGKGDKKYNTLLSEINELDNVRCNHIINTFLLGIALYEECDNFKIQIDKNIEKYVNEEFKKDFFFFWFLICLFHDLGYAEENKGKDSAAFSNDFSKISPLDDVDGVLALFKKVYPYYFLYRKIEFGVVDHGIYAGRKMFHDLCKIREEHASNNSNPKLWREELIQIYNLVSWVVLAHNIWFTLDTDTKKSQMYRKYKLEELILDTDGKNNVVEYPITLQDYPFLFLFCLVDLIEPMKKIGDAECCNSIDFKLNDNTLTISSELKCNCIEEYFNNIAKASEWLCGVEKDTSQGVKIKLC